MICARPSHILVLEDSDEDFETVLDAARRASVPNEIRRALTGDECLRLLNEPGLKHNNIPTLVLLDLNTPLGDGRHALRSLKQEARLRALPIVVLSTSASPCDVSFCYDHGANAYHSKPISYPDHLQVLQEIFGYWLSRPLLPDLNYPKRL